MRGATVVGLAACLAAVVSSAHAQTSESPWSAPAEVSGARSAGTLAFNGSGQGLALLQASGGVVPPSRQYMLAAPVSPGGAIGSAYQLTRPGYTMFIRRSFGLYSPDRVIAVGETNAIGKPVRPWVAYGRIGQTLGTPRFLAVPGQITRISVASAKIGAAAIIVRMCPNSNQGCYLGRTYLLYKRPGHGLGTPVLLSRRANRFPSTVTLNRRGDVLAVWSADTRAHQPRVFARIRSAAGHLYGSQNLGVTGHQGFVTADLTYPRSAIVAWIQQQVGECDVHGPTITRAAAASRGVFQPRQVLETYTYEGCGRELQDPAISAGSGGTGLRLLAWTGRSGGHFVVRVAAVRGGRVGPSQTVSQPGVDSVLDDLAVGQRGEAVVLWTRGIGGTDQGTGGMAIFGSALAPAAASFGSPELIADGEGQLGADSAIDPTSGRTTALWGSFNPSSGAARYSIRQPLSPY